MDRPPPFEPLPADRRRRRLRALRDGAILAGWLGCMLVPLAVVPIGQSLGYDAYSYWSVDLADPYARTFDSNFTLGALRYTPPMAFLFAPLGGLTWWLFLWLWLALMLACLAFLGRRWLLVLLALPPVALELYHGNVHLPMAVAVAVGFRHPSAWAFVTLTKITPGIGLLWFAVRREWHALAVALGVTGAAALAAHLATPAYWPDFVAATISNLDQPQPFSVPPPLPIRLPLAALLVIWGARTDRPWTVPVAAAMALPIIWPHGLTVALGAVPLLRRGDQAARSADWTDVARLRDFCLVSTVVIGAALAVALVAAGPLSELLRWASVNLDPYGRRP